jgi:hypothetical protein
LIPVAAKEKNQRKRACSDDIEEEKKSLGLGLKTG